MEVTMARTNNTQFIMTFSSPPEYVAEGDRIFNSHAEWMKKTHPTSGEKALLVYDVSKTPELVNPMNPAAGTTGNTVFAVCEVYASQKGLDHHWELAQSWEDFPALNEWLQNCEMHMVNGAQIIRSQ